MLSRGIFSFNGLRYFTDPEALNGGMPLSKHDSNHLLSDELGLLPDFPKSSVFTVAGPERFHRQSGA